MTAMLPDAQPSDAEIARKLRDGRSLEAPPDAVLLRAMAIWQPRPAAKPATDLLTRAAGAVVRRLQAVLSHDSTTAPLPALRSTAIPVRQLLFSADGHDIDLRISALTAGDDAGGGSRAGTTGHSTGWRLSGQVLGPVAAGQAVLRCGAWSAATTWNELCEFSFAPVPAGPCSLLLQGETWDIEIGPIELGTPD